MTNIEVRSREVYNNDPQRRCYNGCHFSTATRWLPWEVIEYDVKDVPRRLEFWRDLNDYAVSFRGKGARREYRESE